MRYLTKCCAEVIESKYRHDFVTCSCGQSSVDGGDAYSRALALSADMFPTPIQASVEQ